MSERPLVLIAEDDPELAAKLEDSVFVLGLQPVGPYALLEDVLEAARTHPLAGALLDVSLRGALVLPVAELLSRRRVPFAFMAAHRGLGFGRFPNVPFMSKPFGHPDIERVLGEILKPRRAVAGSSAVA